MRVTRPIVDGWLSFLDEAEAVLAGRRLLPFWGNYESRGVNLRRVFTEPRDLDVAGWLEGIAAAPYLEKGELTRPEVWERLRRVFGGQFIGYAIWFN